MNLDEIFEQIQQDALEDFKKDLKSDVEETLRSSEARESAKKINKLFVKNGLDPVADPATINQIHIEDDGLVIKLNEDQRRFIKADPIFGKDAMGLKYTDD